MRGIGYARVSTDRHSGHGVSLEAQEAKIRAMATAQGATIIELIVDGGESAKDLRRPGMEQLLTLVDERKVDSVIIGKHLVQFKEEGQKAPSEKPAEKAGPVTPKLEATVVLDTRKAQEMIAANAAANPASNALTREHLGWAPGAHPGLIEDLDHSTAYAA